MHGGKKHSRGWWLAAGLVLCIGLVGCATGGRSLDTIRGRAASDPVVRGPDIPLVPIPPPPLGVPETAGTVRGSAASPVAAPLPEVPVSAPTRVATIAP